MRLIAKNLALGLALTAPPLLAEALSALQAQAPGAGIRLLLYWPVEFGWIVFGGLAFLGLNAHVLRQRPGGWLLGAFAGIAAACLWFTAAFLLVFQVHLWRGGQI